MKKIDYTPINLLKHQENGFEIIKKFCIDNKINGSRDLTLDNIINGFICDKTYCPEVIDALVTTFLSTVSYIDNSYYEKMKNHSVSVNAEIKDVYLLPLILDKWSRAKQIFKPDADFADALLHTDKLCITANMIDHLPYDVFYADLSSCLTFNPIDGVFALVKRYDNMISINLISVTKDLVYFSFYLDALLDENKCAIINFNDIIDADYDEWKPALYELDDAQTSTAEKAIMTRREVNFFILQLIAYLSIDEPQLTESDLTRHTYKKPSPVSKVKNKWSEVRIQDVGIKYGSDFRKAVLNIKNNNESSRNNNKRKSPIPHFRRAHWHKFWVGEGRNTLKVKWIEPVFVGQGPSSNATIHKIKNN